MLATRTVNLQKLKSDRVVYEFDVPECLSLETVLENFDRIAKDDYVLTEVTAEQTKALQNIERVFAKYKLILRSLDTTERSRKLATEEFKKGLNKALREFTGIDHILVRVSKDDDYDASIIPFYKETLSIHIVEMNKDWPSDLHAFARKYIRGFIIHFSQKLIKDFSAKEATSVTLHELGHVYGHTRAMSFLITDYLQSALSWLRIGGFFTWLSMFVLQSFHAAILLVTPSIILMTRTLEFINHREEYGADHFAAHHGYGHHLMTSLKRLGGDEQMSKRKKDVMAGILMKVMKLYFWFFKAGTHPDYDKRICRLYDDIINDYASIHPKLGKEIIAVARQFKCKSAVQQPGKKIAAVMPDVKEPIESNWQTLFDKVKQIFITKRDKR